MKSVPWGPARAWSFQVSQRGNSPLISVISHLRTTGINFPSSPLAPQASASQPPRGPQARSWAGPMDGTQTPSGTRPPRSGGCEASVPSCQMYPLPGHTLGSRSSCHTTEVKLKCTVLPRRGSKKSLPVSQRSAPGKLLADGVHRQRTD